MKYTCEKCNRKTDAKPYPFGYWYYDNDGNHHNIGKEIKICEICLYFYKKERK
jgi:hypothetical protein